MGAREFAAELKSEIETIKSQGIAAIYCDNLIHYLDQVATSPEKEPGPAELERYKADLQLRIDHDHRVYESGLENFKAVISAGQNAIKTMLLINGGAAVALLAYIGHLSETPAMVSKVSALAGCLLPFTFGVLAAGLVSGGTYLAQFLFGGSHPRAIKVGHFVNYTVIVLGVVAYILFGYGMVETFHALQA